MKRFFDPMGTDGRDFNDPLVLRIALLDFIADFANWDNSTKKEYLETSRALTQSAHESLGGAPGTKPLVVDPFAGGGSIPLEALRVGADAFAGDLNPVAVLLNKVVLEYIPKYGQRLADEVRKWGEWIKQEAEKELTQFYLKDPDGATPIAYLWARTIICEGPSCGAEVPLMRSLWLAKKSSRSVALRIVPKPEKKRVDFEIIENVQIKDVGEGTVRRGSATCPCCGFTTPVASVRKQLKTRRGGAADAMMFCVVTTRPGQQGRFYRLPTERDLEAVRKAAEELDRRKKDYKGELSLVPDEPTPQGGGSGAGRAFSQRNYGMDTFEDLFTPRQSLALTTLARLVREAGKKLAAEHENGMAAAVQTCLAFAVDRMADKNASLTMWNNVGEKIEHVFSRQALPITWDFPEVGIFSGSTGNWLSHIDLVSKGVDFEIYANSSGHVKCTSATSNPLPDNCAQSLVTDPPYYDAVPYADLSDFFIVWLKRTIAALNSDIFIEKLAPKKDECIVDEIKGKDKKYFEMTMGKAMAEGRRVLSQDGIGVVVFAHKSTSGWEAQLQAMIDAGWTITGSWPIDTERPGRLRAQDSAALASSIHLVCRPRAPGSESAIGDWRDVLQELPVRIHEWMPRLAQEGVVGADAIFACLGPALEIFSRYSRVEKASGEQVTLKVYLEHVWAAVSKEALAMIFQGADATGFEEDARLTAMWLWTLSTGANGNGNKDAKEESDDIEEDAEASGKSSKISGYVLEYDAARKIAQGLGAHLEQLSKLVEIKGDKARLLPVEERTIYLFGKDEIQAPKRGKKKEMKQLTLSSVLGEAEEEAGSWGEMKAPPAGKTVLDRVHQAMILFAAGRSDALKRFLVEDGIGKDERFWRLAQAFSALYPAGTDEKRWVEGLMAKKKGLGF
jgi:adenine-specific DNA methylase